MNIGKTLRSLRIKKGISKNELCAKTGLNKGYVYRLENDLISPTLVTLEKIASALGETLSAVVKTLPKAKTSHCIPISKLLPHLGAKPPKIIGTIRILNDSGKGRFKNSSFLLSEQGFGINDSW